jgi:class 3 adenylate cyclase
MRGWVEAMTSIGHGEDIGGIAVHIGARVSALAGSNEVLVSSTLRDLVIGVRARVRGARRSPAQGRARRVAPVRPENERHARERGQSRAKVGQSRETTGFVPRCRDPARL